MISLSSGGGGIKRIGLGFDSRGVEDVEDRDDRTLDPDISFSYIDEKIKNVLGHFQKDFEGGVSVDNLGSKFGGYGSFLPAYKRQPSNDISSSNHSQTRKIPPFCEYPCTASQSILEPSSSRMPAYRNSLPPTWSEELKRDGGDKVDMNKPSSTQCFGTEIKPDKPVEKNFLKIRIKLGPNDILPRKNAEIYSGLGLDESPSPSMESPERDDQHYHEQEDSINASPNSIIQTMTTFPVPEELLLSPLPDYLIHITGKESVQMGPISKCRTKSHASMKSNSMSRKYDGVSNQGKCENAVEANTDDAEVHIAPFKGDEGTVGKQKASCSLVSDKKSGQMVTVNEEASSRKKLDGVNNSETNSRKEGNPQGGKAFESEESDFGNQKGRKTLNAKTLDPVKNKTVVNNVPKEVDSKNCKKYVSLNVKERKSSGGDHHRGYLEESKLENQCNITDEVPMKVSKKRSANSIGSKEGPCSENLDKESNSDPFSLEAYGKIYSPPPNNSKGSDPDRSRSNVSPAIINENWVCCDICQTWRLLPISTYPDTLPEKWTCSMLDWLPGMNNCSFSEEETTKALIACSHVAAPVVHNSSVDGGKKVIQVPNIGDNSRLHTAVNNDKNKRLYAINESSPVTDFESCSEGKAGHILGETYRNKHKPLSDSLSGGEKKVKLKNIRDDDRISERENTPKKVDFDSYKNLSSTTARKRRPKNGGDPPPKDSKSNTIHGREAPITKSKRRFLPDLDDQSTQSDDKDHLSESTGVVAEVLRKDEQVKVKKAKPSNTQERQTTVKNAVGKSDVKPDAIKDQNAVLDIGHFSVQKNDQSRKDVGSLSNSAVTATSSCGKVSGPKNTTYNLHDYVVSPVESISSSAFKGSYPHMPISVRKKLLGKSEIQKSSDYFENITQNASQNMVSSPSKKVKDLEPVSGSKHGLVNSREQKPRLEKNKPGCKGDITVQMNYNNCNGKSNCEEADNPGLKISKKETSTTSRRLPPPISEPLEGIGGCPSVVKRQKISVEAEPGGVINCDNNPGRKDPPSQAVNSAFNEARRLKHMADRLKNSWSVIDGIGLYFQAALKFLHVAYLLESCSDNDRNCEVESVQMYRSTAGLFQFCAHEYEKAKEMALAALSFKCVEVASMRVVYGSHSVASRDRHELQMSLQGQSPSSSASDIDNVNNPLTAAMVSAPEKGGIISHPQPGDLTLDGKQSHSLARILNFVSDVNCGMEASMKSEAAFVAAASCCSNSGGSTCHKDGMLLVRKVLDFRFNDVDAILQLTRLAMDSFS